MERGPGSVAALAETPAPLLVLHDAPGAGAAAELPLPGAAPLAPRHPHPALALPLPRHAAEAAARPGAATGGAGGGPGGGAEAAPRALRARGDPPAAAPTPSAPRKSMKFSKINLFQQKLNVKSRTKILMFKNKSF